MSTKIALGRIDIFHRETVLELGHRIGDLVARYGSGDEDYEVIQFGCALAAKLARGIEPVSR